MRHEGIESSALAGTDPPLLARSDPLDAQLFGTILRKYCSGPVGMWARSPRVWTACGQRMLSTRLSTRPEGLGLVRRTRPHIHQVRTHGHRRWQRCRGFSRGWRTQPSLSRRRLGDSRTRHRGRYHSGPGPKARGRDRGCYPASSTVRNRVGCAWTQCARATESKPRDA